MIFFIPKNTETYDQIFERVLTIKCENMYNIVSIFVYMTNIANKYDFYCHDPTAQWAKNGKIVRLFYIGIFFLDF